MLKKNDEIKIDDGKCWEKKDVYVWGWVQAFKKQLLQLQSMQKQSNLIMNDFNSKQVLNIDCYLQQQSAIIHQLPLPYETSQNSQSQMNLKQSLIYILSECEKSSEKSMQKSLHMKSTPFDTEISRIAQQKQKSIWSVSNLTFLNLSAQDTSFKIQQLKNQAEQFLTISDGKRKRQEMLKNQNNELRKRLGYIDLSFLEKLDQFFNIPLNKKRLHDECMQHKKKYLDYKQELLKKPRNHSNNKQI